MFIRICICRINSIFHLSLNLLAIICWKFGKLKSTFWHFDAMFPAALSWRSSELYAFFGNIASRNIDGHATSNPLSTSLNSKTAGRSFADCWPLNNVRLRLANLVSRIIIHSATSHHDPYITSPILVPVHTPSRYYCSVHSPGFPRKMIQSCC